MKRSLLLLALAGTLSLTACGSGDKQDAPRPRNGEFNVGSYADNDNTAAESSDAENNDATAMDYKQSEPKLIDTKMLVYSCDMSIDVLDFDKSLDRIHELISSYNGFIESEVYSDGGSSSQWVYSDDEKWKSLSAVIRVPSASYDSFCSDIEDVGDLRRKNASVENLSTEYSDLKTTLAIYEAKEQRYLDLLESVKNESDAIQYENELTDIQIQIATLKTRMNTIENDVAYSYINLSVNEVRKYTDKPVVKKTDTFGQRLKNTASETWSSFLEFLEKLLFVVIRVLPYLLLFGIIAFIIVKLSKLISKLAEKYRTKHPKPVRPAPVYMQAPPMYPAPQQMPVQNRAPVQGPPPPPKEKAATNVDKADKKDDKDA